MCSMTRVAWNKGKHKPIEWVVEGNCHICTSHKLNQKNGYPWIHRNNKAQGVHRYIYETYIGNIPPQKIVMHTCDNKKCINISHLKIGTQKDNMRDMSEKNRNVFSNLKVKLTPTQVLEIVNSKESCNTLAKKYGVCFQNISLIRLGKNWSKVTGIKYEDKNVKI